VAGGPGESGPASDGEDGADRGIAGIVLAAIVLAAMALGAVVERYQEVKLRDRPALLALERTAGPEGAAIAYTGWNQSYPFFGRRLENRVEILPRSGDPEDQYYDWGGRVEHPFKGGTARRWRRVLDRRGTELVVIARSPFENPERQWMVRRPREFRRIYRDFGTEIWRVLPGARASAGPGAEDRPGRPRKGQRKG
jgi:hypothetical protein